MNIKINSWFGRLGNNIIQLKHVIQMGLFYSSNIHSIIFPKHQYFNTTSIVINDNLKPVREFITDKSNFFFNKEINGVDQKLFELNLDRTIEILKSIFVMCNVPKLNEDELVIHIRSGDIFRSNPHNEYIMPPLSYYKDIINKNSYSKIHLIAEDRKNPVIDELLKIYPNISFKIQDLLKDIELLLGASNVIESYGTFTSALLILSDNIKTIHKPSYQSALIICRPQVEILSYDLEEYKTKLKPWRNTKSQREIMIGYSK
jgi:hypothetical protein